MSVLINHAIAFLTSPLSVALALVVIGLALVKTRRATAFPHLPRIGIGLAVAGVVWLWFMSSGIAFRWLGLGLERMFPPQRVEELPCADAIVLLGGGMGGNTNTVCYPELYPAADRVVHAARLWKAGKAPIVMASGTNELVSTTPFLLELGVPRQAIRIENKSGNTEENARAVAHEILAGDLSRGRKVLLVTSSWHMRRALLMFRKYAPEIEVVPAPCDYEATLASDEFRILESLLPSADNLLRNSTMLKEIIGYWGYLFLRRGVRTSAAAAN